MNEIMSISRLRMGTDGKGITTLVAFFGCPLNCKYCLNPQCKADNTVRAQYTPEELMEVVDLDNIYFQMTGGGITFGGGEPLLSCEWIGQFCRIANPDWKIRIETSLNVPWTHIAPLVQYVDHWIIDVKDMNEEIYRRYTGKDNRQVVENLARLQERVTADDHIYIRLPLIPGYNECADVEKSLKHLTRFKNIERFTYTI